MQHYNAPSIHYCRPDLVLADGDYVISRNTSEMTHTGEFMGLPPSAQRVTVTGIDISRLHVGKIAEIWHQEDVAGLPVGVQVVARPWREHVALAAMAAIEAVRARNDTGP